MKSLATGPLQTETMATPPTPTTVRLDALRLSPRAPAHFTPTSSAALRRLVSAHGLVLPLPVRPLDDQTYEILAHPRLWDAARACALPKVPVIVLGDSSDPEAEALIAQHYRAAPTQDVDPITRAQGFHADLVRLRETSRQPYRLLSVLTGLRRTALSHAIRLLTLPREAQLLIRTGSLKPRHARCLVTLPSAEVQVACAHEIVDQRLSATQAEALARAYRAAPHAERARAAMNTSTAGKDPDIVRLEHELGELTGCPTQIATHSITFRFTSLDELDGLLRRLRTGSPLLVPNEDIW